MHAVHRNSFDFQRWCSEGTVPPIKAPETSWNRHSELDYFVDKNCAGGLPVDRRFASLSFALFFVFRSALLCFVSLCFALFLFASLWFVFRFASFRFVSLLLSLRFASFRVLFASLRFVSFRFALPRLFCCAFIWQDVCWRIKWFDTSGSSGQRLCLD